MSEYQYYEFLAIDRPLTSEEMSALRALSTRAHITPVSFTNQYQWGNFKGNPDELMKWFFDAHVYVANWMTAIFMVRMPIEAISEKTAEAMAIDGILDFEGHGNPLGDHLEPERVRELRPLRYGGWPGLDGAPCPGAGRVAARGYAQSLHWMAGGRDQENE